jgi:hypothetical protein
MNDHDDNMEAPGIYPLEACLLNEDRGVLDLWGKEADC